MLGIFNKLIDANERELKRLAKIVEQISSLEGKIKRLTDAQLKDKALDLRKKVQQGQLLDNLLPEVFALVREVALREIGERHFDVQLMAAVALHQGKIAEQKTGEGKTLSASPALFLNSLLGQGVHLVTVNDYLARRDCGWMGPIYYVLGASCTVIVHEAAYIYDPKYTDQDATDKRLKHLKLISREEAYQADITYGTNTEFGFDYLRDNMANSLKRQVQRGHHFAIVDEVDSILIDEARTPLIISAPAQEPTEKYVRFAQIIERLSLDTDYVIDEKLKGAHLSEHGILKVEKILGVDNLYEKDFATLHHLEEALKAKTVYHKDRDYVVKDDQVIIVDEFTGRLMFGRRFSEGLHQAIEAKEGVEIQQESQTLATISLQNYFRMYTKLAGMTGTAATEAEEFHKIYKLDVVMIPTHQKMIRKDLPDAIYKTATGKFTAVAVEIERIHATSQPVLVGTTSIEKNEQLSQLLKRKGISHALLNAKNHEKEAEIIAAAGEAGAVTVATNMAGRGVDIKLGKGVVELGGLYVIGTERHESRRIDNQLRGRSGRQGDHGTSKFFVALDDDLMRLFGGDQVAKVMAFLKMPEDIPIEHPLVSKAIESSQKKVEGHNFDIRKHTVEYDDVMNQQRQIIYGVRQQILETAASVSAGPARLAEAPAKRASSVSHVRPRSLRSSAVTSRDLSSESPTEHLSLKEEILQKVDTEITNVVTVYSTEGLETGKIVEEFTTIIPVDEDSKKNLVQSISQLESTEKISDFLIKLARSLYEEREKQVGAEEVRRMEVFVYLTTIDTLWMEHLDSMDDLRVGIGLRGYAQRDPLIEYKKEAFDMFERLMISIDSEVVHRIFRTPLQTPQPMEIQHQAAPDQPILVKEAQSVIGTQAIDKQGATSFSEGPTKVTIEKGGQVVAQQVIDEGGSIHRQKVGRNDPCHCGSGKKYKRCHYPN